MIRLHAPTARFMYAASPVLAMLLLAACAGPQSRPQAPPPPATASKTPSKPAHKPWKSLGPYTPGGLYAPGVADGAPEVPPDIASLPEPVPHPEPLAHYGNRSPYVVLGKTYTVLPSAADYVERGMASWYGTKFDGRVTSSLEPYDLTQFTAAHRTLPLPSYARVTNLENGRSVIVRINDRGPFHDGRLIDLSYAAAIKLGVNVHGTAMVEVRGIDTSKPNGSSPSDAIATKPVTPHAPPTSPKRTVAGTAPLTGNITGLPVAISADGNAATPADTSVPAPIAGLRTESAPSPDASNAEARTATAIPAPAPAASMAPPSDSTNPTPAKTSAFVATTTPAAAAATQPPAPSAPAAANTPPIATTTTAASTGPTPADARSARAASANPSRPQIEHPPMDPSTLGFLQIASYGDRDNAERMLQRLQQAGIEHGELVSVQVADQTLWRVHIGPMRADEATGVAARLQALGFGTPPFFKD